MKTDRPIERPTLLLDKKRVLSNIERMATRAREGNVAFRPHFKTHQSPAVGEWFRDFGVERITVSSVAMAQGFASHGWTDITVAFPANLRERDAFDDLAGKVDLGILFDREDTARAVDDGLSHAARAWIKVDTGYGRVGVPWDQPDRVLALAQILRASRHLAFQGLLTHSGHSYREQTVEGVQRVHDEAVARLAALKERLSAAGIPHVRISVGDTPTCSLAENFQGVDEIRPGNFVFYDLMQQRIGACGEEEIAVAVACPVVGIFEARGEIALYGGAVHLAKESLPDASGRTVFGVLASGEKDSLGRANRSAQVVSLSQEHGIVEADEALLRVIRIGDLVRIFPVHSCLTCNLHRQYRTLEGERLSRLAP
ncbi:MAG: alanine racemase [Planctomycetota bacterium]|jgi:D-serine deaminase-like pyridoxal phosphate-dependent protein